jgi:tRNA(fMet)-specific endonuclease VapC
MNTVVLDTNTYVAYLNGNEEVVAYVRAADQLVLPFVVIGELYYGFFRGTKTAENSKILSDFLNSPRVSIWESTPETAIIFGELAAELADKGKPIQQNDIWIAALCKQHSSPLLTLDKGFKHIVGLQLLPV